MPLVLDYDSAQAPYLLERTTFISMHLIGLFISRILQSKLMGFC